ncbi:hypothetical protein MSMTP_0384 [Methanosarcina sp. MTP4]|uniref:zinc-dependent metalloprotease n=1 Tax=Methanosarcina sp. MTP4 TaxID=1434100 RepID=UPI0006157EE4|nr:zinc-dependent metalloprotease [Methanosarcina sp. MTP4]AKB23853.1 hypothetical protein MSMTP_0384 [Methanosarcina sp. MTP4]
MIANRKFGIGVLLAALLVSAVFVPAVSAAGNVGMNEEGSIGTPWFEKGDELNQLSGDERRSLAEQNETVKKMIEEDLKIKSVQIENLDDLENLPTNYPENIKKVITENFTSKYISQQSPTMQTTMTNTVNVWIVADEEYRDTFGSNWQTQAYNTIENADDAFYSDHSINFVVGKYSTWDSTDSTDNSSVLLAEAQSETGWNSNQQGMDMLAIFTDQSMDHRGRSESMNYNGGDAWIMKHQITSGWDWHLAQHEASHNYNCPDHGYAGPTCIMTYTFMMTTDNWCSGCDQTIEANRNHF